MTLSRSEAQGAAQAGGRVAIPRRPTFWRRIKQRMLPETTWLAELRREAAPALGGRSPRAWLRLLSSPNSHRRQEALRAYRTLPPAARCLLTAGAYVTAIEYTNNIGAITLLAAITLILVGGALDYAGGLAAGTIIAALLAGVITGHVRTGRRQELAKDLLDNSHDARLVPFLALRLLPARNDTWKQRQTFAGRNLRNALVRLLPLVQEADAAEWTNAHWYALLYCLRNPYANIELTQAVLQTVARVGNEEAYRAMRALKLEPDTEEFVLTGRNRAPRTANQQVLIQTQQECLPILEARLEAQRHAQTLLRASGASFLPAGDILLRPADASLSETPAEQLLRPHSQE